MTSTDIRAFVSYTHDSKDHRARALNLAQKLRENGIICQIDQFVPAPAEGWPRWMHAQIDTADFVLIVCSTTYMRRFEGNEAAPEGHGADWEGMRVMQELYERKSINDKFIPILFEGSSPDDIPKALRPYTYHRWPKGHEDLYRQLTRQPCISPAPLGKPMDLPLDP